jgi:hypothetical protein
LAIFKNQAKKKAATQKGRKEQVNKRDWDGIPPSEAVLKYIRRMLEHEFVLL